MRALLAVLGVVLVAASAHAGGVGANATCWNLLHEGQWHRLCHESTTRGASGRDCAPAGGFEVCVAGTHQTRTTCGLPTSPHQVTCTTQYVGLAVGNGTLPGGALAAAETWGDQTSCSWPDVRTLSATRCAAGTFTTLTLTIAKGTCQETPRAVWRAEAASWLFGGRTAATGALEAWSTTCAW